MWAFRSVTIPSCKTVWRLRQTTRRHVRRSRVMAEVFVQRGHIAWSKWNVAMSMIEATVDRVGLRAPSGAWHQTENGLRFEGSPAMCEAIAVALEGLGLRVEVHTADRA
jgi:hypothetical protein